MEAPKSGFFKSPDVLGTVDCAAEANIFVVGDLVTMGKLNNGVVAAGAEPVATPEGYSVAVDLGIEGLVCGTKENDFWPSGLLPELNNDLAVFAEFAAGAVIVAGPCKFVPNANEEDVVGCSSVMALSAL